MSRIGDIVRERLISRRRYRVGYIVAFIDKWTMGEMSYLIKEEVAPTKWGYWRAREPWESTLFDTVGEAQNAYIEFVSHRGRTDLDRVALAAGIDYDKVRILKIRRQPPAEVLVDLSLEGLIEGEKGIRP